MAEQMTTKKCKARGCPDLIIFPNSFGYHCQVTGEVPRHMDGCPKELTRPVPILDLASTPTSALVDELLQLEGVHQEYLRFMLNRWIQKSRDIHD